MLYYSIRRCRRSRAVSTSSGMMYTRYTRFGIVSAWLSRVYAIKMMVHCSVPFGCFFCPKSNLVCAVCCTASQVSRPPAIATGTITTLSLLEATCHSVGSHTILTSHSAPEHTLTLALPQAQISYDKDAAAVSARELEEKISRSNTAQESLAARIREAEAARVAAELKAGELLRRSSLMESELSEALEATDKALEESLAERARVEAMQGDLATLRDKYSTLKRRYVDAGRKVRSGVGVAVYDSAHKIVVCNRVVCCSREIGNRSMKCDIYSIFV